MLIDYTLGQVSVILRVKVRSTATGNGLTGLTGSSMGLVISTIADTESTATVYTAAGSTIQAIGTPGTYVAPAANNCRFGQVDATSHPGIYELQLANARFAVAGSKSLLFSITGAASQADCDAVIPLRAPSPFKINTPAPINFYLVSSIDHVTPVTGEVVIASRAIAGNAFAVCTGTVAEVAPGVGAYRYLASAADMNGTDVIFRFTSPGSDACVIPINTVP
jgi:hypothetical protein